MKRFNLLFSAVVFAGKELLQSLKLSQHFKANPLQTLVKNEVVCDN
jgi:hypothetical protein